jgi:type IV secretory pathway TraG/TraD family ATPase VirD4
MTHSPFPPCILGTTHGYGSYPHAFSDYARARHAYVIGKTGSGKSTLLLNMIAQDLAAGRGLCVIDPHGDLSAEVLALIPTHRAHELIYIDPSDTEQPIGFNPIATVAADHRAFVATNVVAAMRHIWADTWGARLEHLLFNAVLTLQAIAKPNLFLIERLLTDDAWRQRQLEAVSDPIILSFWHAQFDAMNASFRNEALSPVLNKTGRLTQDPYIRNIIAQPKATFDIARSMDEGRIIVLNLAKGRIGETPSHLLGALFVTALAQAAFARADRPAAERTSFTVYADELQHYASDSFAQILSESRKYNLHLVCAHQFLAQLPDGLSDAILGNVGTIIALRVAAADAATLAAELGMHQPEALTNLDNHRAWIKTLDHVSPLTVEHLELAPPPKPLHGRGERLRQNARIRFGCPRTKIDAHLAQLIGDTACPVKAAKPKARRA